MERSKGCGGERFRAHGSSRSPRHSHNPLIFGSSQRRLGLLDADAALLVAFASEVVVSTNSASMIFEDEVEDEDDEVEVEVKVVVVVVVELAAGLPKPLAVADAAAGFAPFAPGRRWRCSKRRRITSRNRRSASFIAAGSARASCSSSASITRSSEK